MRHLHLFAWVFAVGCSSTEVRLSDYGRSCTQDADCVEIRIGDACGCEFQLGAINVSDEERARRDLSDAHSHCAPSPYENCIALNADRRAACSAEHVCEMKNGP
jgi:hypothetical protein